MLAVVFVQSIVFVLATQPSEYPAVDTNYCESITTTYPSYNYNITCTLGGDLSLQDCDVWTVKTVILLQDDALVFKYTRLIGNFMSTVTESCSSSSYFNFFPVSKTECPKQEQIDSATEQFFGNLNRSEIVPPTGESSGDTLYEILNVMDKCVGTFPSGVKGGAVFIFINYDCTSLCYSEKLVKTNADVLANWLNLGYNIRIIYATPNEDPACFATLFPSCQSPFCRLIWNNNEASFNRSASAMTTCPQENDDKQPNNDNLALEIALPIVCTIALSALVSFLWIKKDSIKNSRFFKWLRFRKNKHLPRFSNATSRTATVSKPTERVDTWEVSASNLNFGTNQKLGSGAFATVYKARLTSRIPLLSIYPMANLVSQNSSEGGYEVAVKRLPPHANEHSRDDFLQEIDFMKKLGYHAHVLSLVGCVSQRLDPLIIVEYCSNGDLLKFLRSNRSTFGQSDQIEKTSLCEKDLLSIAWQISDGMTYLSQKNIVHRDLAARNILLTENMVAKVADFGMCRYVNSELYTSRGGRLPIKWMAPESLQFYEFTTKSDVWSYSILLFELFSLGEAPFPAIEPVQMIEHLQQGNRMQKPEICPDKVYSIMEWSWKQDPAERPEFMELREELTSLLNANDVAYGYLDLMQEVQQDESTRSTPDEVIQESRII